MAIGTRRRRRIRQVFALVKEVLPEAHTTVEGSVIDWSSGGIYTKQVSADESFTFSNDEEGKTILVILENTSDSPVTITFPGGLRKKTALQNTLQPSTQSMYTLVKSGNGIYIHQDVFDTLTEFPDTDGDGVKDNLDAFPNDATETVDTDNDGVGDNADAFPNDATETVDTDGDGVGDNADNAPLVANSDQADTDQDGLPDVLDSDIDNDGVLNEQDISIFDPTTPDVILENYIDGVVLRDVQNGTLTYDFQDIHSYVPNPEIYNSAEVTSILKIDDTKILLSVNAYRTETISTQETIRDPQVGEYTRTPQGVGDKWINDFAINGNFRLVWAPEDINIELDSFPYTLNGWTYHLGAYTFTSTSSFTGNINYYGVYRTRVVDSTSEIITTDEFKIEYDIVNNTYTNSSVI